MRTRLGGLPVLFVLWTILLGLTCGCERTERNPRPKQLLIYCGTTMIKPMSEIARIIEQRENCEILITKDGSGNLFKSIKINQIGDLYLPGCDSYIKTCLHEGFVTETICVGCNRAAMMVLKGNPKGITADLGCLANKHYYVVLCNPESGSIGKETKRILEKRGVFATALDNARKLTTDSKSLVHVLKSGEADLVINWYAVSTWPENMACIDVLEIDEKYAVRKKLVLGLLRTSRHPGIARKFMEYAASDEGRALFAKYGLYRTR